ncbi:putative bifunctional diguanylate cyclase/phosphodiesterase [Tateyamaria armeniaca]|uniref:Bifunctional diguanylate cyclase/phosphodiesterase n=1 Tax=Tateyamaria armeniaca TaxID=2518930 RepID=A0ABW8UYC4_9RHOB
MAAIVGYFFAAEAELFEEFYEFSRSHESWDLDEIVLVYIVGAAAVPILLLRSKSRLKRAMKAVSAAEESAQHAARHDGLTGLFNRRYFSELLDTAIDNAAPDNIPVVLLLDLDRFKAINDLRGHAEGDRVLQEIAARVLKCCHEGQKAARLGGDEFAILMTDTSGFSGSTSLARRLLTAIAEPIAMDGWYATVGASIGICGWRDGENAQAIVRNADQAMYQAKQYGRGGYTFYNEDLGDQLKQQALLEEELKGAVERMDIEPFFQPIVDIENGHVKGFEVLSRWTSPTLGAVPPDIFITIAEDMGLIDAITWQVMRKALKVAASWDNDLFIAFNMSPHLFNDELLMNIKWQLSESKFDPKRMEIEITENAVIGNMDEARVALDSLKDLGIQVSLDDFGTGFSSLATLSKLPFDKIKIDKSFVTDLDSMPQNAKIVGAILALAKSMEIAVTAEGIETNDDLNFLSAHECLQGQGYLFARPMHAQDVSNFLADANELERGGKKLRVS